MKYLISVLFFSFLSVCIRAQEPWKESQLMDPSVLAAQILAKKNPVIISVGPAAIIPGSADMGMANNAAQLEKLKAYLSNIPKDQTIVLYCGCCPFEHCPNVRPAFSLLNSMGFTHHLLLNLPHNIKTDWMNKGYPVAK
jgi:hypothetical protein